MQNHDIQNTSCLSVCLQNIYPNMQKNTDICKKFQKNMHDIPFCTQNMHNNAHHERKYEKYAILYEDHASKYA